MNTGTMMYAVMIILTMMSGVLYVAFGQLTVRKLRKNPKTKDALGFEFMSGWDILNTAKAMAFPRSWSRKLEKSGLSAMHAKADLLFENTTRFDQILAIVFYWFFVFTGLFGISIVILDSFGFFES